MTPVAENIASTGTDAEDKYSSESLLSMENRPECCCQKANGSLSQLIM